MATKTETQVSELKINILSESDYNTALENGEINENELYLTPNSVSDSSDITVSTSGNGNAITAISANGTTITATKGSTFLTSHPTISKSTDSTSTASPAHGGTFTAVDSVTRDSNGHVTKVNTKTVTLPSDNNTDTKVTQAYSTNNSSYPILMSATSGVSSTSSRGNTTSVLNNQIYGNPSTGTITAKTFSGNLSGNATTSTTATKLGSSTVGSNTKPIYLNSGTATASSSTVGGVAKPMYLNSGTMTACSSTVGSSSKPVYMNSGTITAVTSIDSSIVKNSSGDSVEDRLPENLINGAGGGYYKQSESKRVASGTATTLSTFNVTNSGWYYVQGEVEDTTSTTGYKLGYVKSASKGWICSSSLGNTATNRLNFSTMYDLTSGDSLDLIYQHSSGSSVTAKYVFTVVRMC